MSYYIFFLTYYYCTKLLLLSNNNKKNNNNYYNKEMNNILPIYFEPNSLNYSESSISFNYYITESSIYSNDINKLSNYSIKNQIF